MGRNEKRKRKKLKKRRRGQPTDYEIYACQYVIQENRVTTPQWDVRQSPLRTMTFWMQPFLASISVNARNNTVVAHHTCRHQNNLLSILFYFFATLNISFLCFCVYFSVARTIINTSN